MEAVIFDLDGVIVDSEKHWNRAEEEMFRETAGTEVEVRNYEGLSITNTYEKLSERYDVDLTQEEFYEMYENRAEEIYLEKAELMKGFKSLTEELRDRGLLIGLATGSYWPDLVVERFNLDFGSVVGAGDVEGKGKPEPETYRKAVERAGEEPSESVAVDDTEAGVKSAKNAGIYSIGYNHSDREEAPENADERIGGPEKLRSRLLELADK